MNGVVRVHPVCDVMAWKGTTLLLLSHLCGVFTIMYLTQTVFLAFTVYGTCNVISHAESSVLLHYHFPKYVRCFLQFLDFMVSCYVA